MNTPLTKCINILQISILDMNANARIAKPTFRTTIWDQDSFHFISTYLKSRKNRLSWYFEYLSIYTFKLKSFVLGMNRYEVWQNK